MEDKKESATYLGFFKENTLLILIPAFTVSLSAYFYQLQQPPIFHKSILMEMEYNQEDVLKKITLADEAVTLLRTSQVQQELGISKDLKVTTVKNGPLAINLDVSGRDEAKINTDLDKLAIYSKERFPLKNVGVSVESIKKTSEFIYATGGLMAGLLIGIFFSLIKTYFKKY